MKTISRTQLLEQLNWRYATKQFNPTRQISAEDWSALEETLALSPSSCGLQPWKFLVVTDLALREKLVSASYGQTQVRDASHLVVFTVKKHFGEADVDAHIQRTAQLRGISVESLAPFRNMLIGGIVNAMNEPAREGWAARQAYIALGNLLTSAALLGIDACPMEGFAAAQYDALLGLEAKGLTAVVVCALGYRSAQDGYAGLPKVRFPQDQIVLHV